MLSLLPSLALLGPQTQRPHSRPRAGGPGDNRSGQERGEAEPPRLEVAGYPLQSRHPHWQEGETEAGSGLLVGPNNGAATLGNGLAGPPGAEHRVAAMPGLRPEGYAHET